MRSTFDPHTRLHTCVERASCGALRADIQAACRHPWPVVRPSPAAPLTTGFAAALLCTASHSETRRDGGLTRKGSTCVHARTLAPRSSSRARSGRRGNRHGRRVRGTALSRASASNARRCRAARLFRHVVDGAASRSRRRARGAHSRCGAACKGREAAAQRGCRAACGRTRGWRGGAGGALRRLRVALRLGVRVGAVERRGAGLRL